MKRHRNIVPVFVVTVVSVAMVLTGLYYVRFTPWLLPREEQLIRFSYERARLITREAVSVSGLKSPIDIPEIVKRDFPSVDLRAMAPRDGTPPEPRKEFRLSLVLIKDQVRMAVIEGLVVKEGDVTKIGRVKKIEKGGVLIAGEEGERWLKID
jgi:hypothetical protein